MVMDHSWPWAWRAAVAAVMLVALNVRALVPASGHTTTLVKQTASLGHVPHNMVREDSHESANTTRDYSIGNPKFERLLPVSGIVDIGIDVVPAADCVREPLQTRYHLKLPPSSADGEDPAA